MLQRLLTLAASTVLYYETTIVTIACPPKMAAELTARIATGEFPEPDISSFQTLYANRY